MIDLMPLLAAALFGASPVSPPQPSFDCAKATHLLEKTICKSDALSQLDRAVAESYREKLGIVFDKASFRTQQRNWQQVLRTHCARVCAAADVERDYTRQLDFLDKFREEDWSANYKTADVAYLHIDHQGSLQFLFTIKRDLEDDKPETLCAMGGDMIATFLDIAPTSKARWVDDGGKCTVDFAFDRDKTGNVTRIAVSGSDGCRRYCPNKQYMIDDNYLPDNAWAVGNQ
ncbi:MAG: hypothetical protein JWN66_2499 [Sphingomonas bacterium]|uniref:lysozyme inhibitor LprI family protein n=1 Tax=Sphingomonas bacterium TaxID=1895847 RepID=UPI002608593B|nr:hypothetical protein [Sphingomonas bacterium]MDB5705383.1 hypothetical protein [Sphingomonas bacterium]